MFNGGRNFRNIKLDDFFSKKTTRDRIIFLLQFATLAPSTHNSQPWLFKIIENSCEIYFDPDAYNIKQGDPLKRDLYVSFGCLIENFAVAASYFGVFQEVQYSKNSGNLVATVYFKNLLTSSPSDPSKLPLLKAILERVNARGLFEKQGLENDFLGKLKNLPHDSGITAHFVTEQEKINRLASLTAQGLEEAYHDPSFRREMSSWVTHSLSSRLDGIPGYSLRMPFLISFIFPWLLRHKDIGSKVGKLNYISASSAPLIMVFTAKENSKHNWLETGRLAEKIMLEARVAGLKTSIFVAAIEIGDLFKEVQNVIDSKEIPQLLMCVGRMRFNQKPNQRHPVEHKLIQ